MKFKQLYQLIDEALNKTKVDGCQCEDCGCNENKAPLLTESKVKPLLSEGLQYHIDKKTPLHETIYRYGSEKHLMLIKEARRMYSRGVIDLNEADKQLVETNLGEFALYEGKEVPLDLPMVNEEYSTFDENKNWKQVGDTVYVKNVFGDEPEEKPKYDPKKGLTDLQKFVFKYESDISDEDSAKKHLGDIQQLISPDDVYDYYAYDRGWEGEMDDDLENIYKQVKKKFPNLNEAKKKKSQKKDPPLGKPKRGGSKAYYVYVRDPKTKRIKKVSFGSGGLRAKIKDSKARSAFAKRHRCSEKNDRTKPSYWSCRLPRYAQALGLGSNSNTFW